MRARPTRRVLLYLQLIAVPVLCLAFLFPPSGSGPKLVPSLLAQPTRPRGPTNTPKPPEATPTWTVVPPTLTPTATRVPPTPTPTATYTPTPTPTPTNTPDVLATLVVRTPEPTAVQEIASPSGSIQLTFSQLGYGIAALNRSRPTQRYVLDLPGSWEIAPSGNDLLLTIHYFSEEPQVPASLEVEINGSGVYAMLLDLPDLTSLTLRISIPQGLLQVGRNQLVLDLVTEATCETGGNIADVWIDDTSMLDLRYSLSPYPPDLSRYPYPFVEDSVLYVPTAIVLPDRPTAGELSAALTLAAGLGQGSGGTIELTVIRARDFDPAVHAGYHLIAIGQQGSNALFGALALSQEFEAEAAKAGQGVAAMMISPWDAQRLVLVVSAPDGDGLWKAATALLGEVQALPAGTTVAAFSRLAPADGERAQAPWPRVTLASLGYGDTAFYGSKLQDVSIDLTLPLGWPLGEPSIFVLRFTHAAELDPEQSVLRVSLNGMPVGSANLQEASASGGQVGISLPPGVLRSGHNRLEIAAELSLPGVGQAECAYLDDQQLWAIVDAESELLVPDSVASLERSLSDFPYPFSRTFEPNPTLFVLPDEPSPVVLEHAFELAVRLGSPTLTGHATCRAAYASTALSQLGRGQHLILVGTLFGNLFSQEFGSHLPRWIGRGGTAIVDGKRVELSEDRDLGLLEINDSPWNDAYGLLTVSGTTDDGLGLAVQALLGQMALLEGDVAVVGPAPTQTAGQPRGIIVHTDDTRPADAVPEGPGVVDPSVQARLAERWWK